MAKRYNNESPAARSNAAAKLTYEHGLFAPGHESRGRLRARMVADEVENRRMLFGHNTNVAVNGVVIHVQSEDRGRHSAVLDTTVYHRGRVLHRRTSKYSDLLPLDSEREQILKVRLHEQHAAVIDELRSGKLAVDVAAVGPAPAGAAPTAPSPGPAAAPATPAPLVQYALTVDLLNPRTWLTGKRATLYLVVRDRMLGTVSSGVRLSARIDGGAEKTEVTTMTGADGHAQLQFDMPRLTSEDTTLVIEAVAGEARGQLRFQLRAKPKVPAAG
jgi:hypothetical protein